MQLQAEIEQFLEFTGSSDARTAEDFIRGNDNLEKAIQAFFDDSSPLKYREARSWNEGSFAAGKDGAKSQMEELPPYQMDEGDKERESRQRLRPLGAPSRPPSREKSRTISLRSIQRDVDMPQYGPQQPDEEDADMREAIRLSMEDQQTGIIATSGAEYVPDVDLADRVRQPGEPGFLKPLPSNVFLPALVTILHSIPQCRELLLSRYDLLVDYGENRRWWEGEPVETTRIIDSTEHDASYESLKILTEVQRLMAFLDVGDRSYASAGSLGRMNAVKNAQSPSTPLEPGFARFLHAWQNASEHSRTAYNFEYPFRSTIQGPHPYDVQNIHCVDIPNPDFPSDSTPTLYDVLDSCFWPSITSTTSAEIASLSQIAPVMVMRVAARKRSPGSKNIIIPETLFADRYMDSSKDLVKQMRVELAEQYDLIGELEERLGYFDVYQHPSSGKIGSASKLIHSAIELVGHHDGGDLKEQQPEETIVAMAEDDTQLPASQVLSRLEQIHHQLRTSIDEIMEDQAQITANIRKLGTLLTDPTIEEGPRPTKEYKLRGVGLATTNVSQTVYMTYPPAVVGLIELDTPDAPWWRISYDTAGDKALVTKEQVSEKTVLDAAGELLSETLLIYASTPMLVPSPDEPLPAPLQEFIAHENAAFRLELEGSPPPVDIIEGQPIELDDIDAAVSDYAQIAAFPQPPPTVAMRSIDSDVMDSPIEMSATVLDPTLLGDFQTGAAPLRTELREMQEVQRTNIPRLRGGGSGGEGIVTGNKRRASRGIEPGPYGLRGGDVDGMELEMEVGVGDDRDDDDDSEAATLIDVSDGEGDKYGDRDGDVVMKGIDRS